MGFLSVFALLALLLWGISPSATPALAKEPSPKSQTKTTEASRARPFPVVDLFNPDEYQVEVVADHLEYARDQKKVIASGNVVLTYRNRKLTADYAEVETDTQKAYAKGHVIIYQGDKPKASGEEVYYDFKRDSGSFPDGRFFSEPWFSQGKEVKQITEGRYEIRDGRITTCNWEDPHYHIHAKKVTILTGDKMIAWNVTIYVLGKPVFWWPYLIIPQRRQQQPLAVTVGYNDRHGVIVETTKGIAVNKNVGGEINLDWRSLRGVGGGGRINYDYGRFAKGDVRAYLTQDKRAFAPATRSSLKERLRGRFLWRHRTDFDDHTFLLLRYNRMADETFLSEFFQKEDRSEVEPQSFVTFTKNSERHGFMVHNEKRMNDFESLVEKLPQIRLDWKNQPFFGSWLYYQSQTSFSNFNKRFRRMPHNEDVMRADSVHEWYLPLKWNEIKLMPFTRLRGTYYSRQKADSEDRFRALFEYGADLRTHFYKTFAVSSNKLGIEINHLRHVVEPFVRYRGISSTVSDEEVNEFDPVDRLDDANIITFGLENRIQTKRVIDGKMRRVDIVSLNTFLSYEMHPDGQSRVGLFAPFNDGRTASNFTLLSQEIVLRPYDWLQYELRTDYDMERDRFRVFNQDLLVRTRRFKILFGHRFSNDIGESRGSNQFVFDGRWVINPLWTVGGYIRWDTKKEELQEWQISATRDLHDFILDFGYNVRHSDLAESNKTIFFNFRLKAFPEVTVHSGNRASFSEPRIGETVAGVNQGYSRAAGYHFEPLLSRS